MKALINAARQFAKDEEGITAIEYGLLAAVIAAAIIASFGTLATGVGTAFTTIAGRLADALG
ncbi:Flp family type IVb pilin [Pseudoduganella albidiflava]|uniref:Flp family type IVb pilin n=1 Tax=Pseudoduganella albidiflava TaxID=321983 RepID=A0A411X567_9BURK|nr:Flp family type IVb pilin [Pseudoduganella albidiflava]QBI04169.1 Flp family type IVb pilin [Pseudoduganella albidiflava]GGY25195.1 hypothetical protein GCM10007387_03530 [Pseudoduganella albidiflava]